MKHFRFLLSTIFIMAWGIALANQPVRVFFKPFELNNQFPTKTITTIFPDRKGYIWFGSQDGLIRFDGHTLKTFRSSSKTPGRLLSNEILAITADKFDRIWIGTTDGIMLLDQTRFTLVSPDIPQLKLKRVNAIISDHEGFLWIGTASDGIVKLDPATMRSEHFTKNSVTGLKLKSNNIMNLFEDSENRIWVTSWKEGLTLISKNREQAISLPKAGNTDNAIKLVEDKDGLIWVGTWDDGLFYVHEGESGEISFNRFIISDNSDVLVDNIVYNMAQDTHFGFMWLTTYNGMVTAKKNANGSITVMKTDRYFLNEPKKTIHTISIDYVGNLWLGTISEGAYKMSFNQSGIRSIDLIDNDNQISVPPHINRICEIPGSGLMVAVNRAGPFWMDLQSGEIKRTNNAFLNSFRSVGEFIYLEDIDEFWISHLGQDKVYAFKINQGKVSLLYDFSLSVLPKPRENSINKMFEDSNSNVWFATKNGLYIKSPGKPSYKLNIKSTDLIGVTEDKFKNIWVGSFGNGLFKIKKSEVGNEYTYEQVDLTINNFYCKKIQTICATVSGDVYVGSEEGFLFRINPVDMEINELSNKYGITENSILNISEDDQGHLWLMTKTKLIRYNPETNTSHSDHYNGVTNSTFFKNSDIRLTDGNLLFGGNRGLSLYGPTKKQTPVPVEQRHVNISDIFINSQSIYDGDNILSYNYKKNLLKLKHNQNQIVLLFSAFDFLNTNNVKYAYMLKGVDRDWQYGVGDQHQVYYSGLPYGNYTFMVKANTSESLWSNEITELNISILPPFYLSWIAKSLYVLFVLFVVIFVLYTYLNRLKLRNQLQIVQIDQVKSEELIQTKLQYFTNISHELLTPLSIISLQLEKLDNLKQIEPSYFKMIRDNIFRLKRLASQILTFRKAESRNLQLSVAKSDIVKFIRKIVEIEFKPLFDEKQIRTSFNSDILEYKCFFDADKLDKILYNLVSNACKFSRVNGIVDFNLKSVFVENEEFVQISVSDNGCGIAKDELDQIFNRFFTSKTSDQSQSHGVGLSLTRDLVELHKGEISVISELNKGTTFTVQLPISISAYSENEIALNETVSAESAEIIEEHTFKEKEAVLLSNDFCVLIVEDNIDLRNLMASKFSKNYEVITASNGLEALDCLQKLPIDLVISDLMMPQMDGLTLCKTIRSTPEINHVNILILTAKNNPSDRIECYNAGADGYISKPFEMDVLEARVNNLFEKRRQVIENFNKNYSTEIEKLSYNPIDQAFMNNAIAVVKDHIEEENLDLEKFASLMNSSKSTLYRKIKYLTGLSPIEFIRDYKLKYARELMASKIATIAEIAYSVGFSSPKYFSKCFKNEFGVTPSEFRENFWNEIE